jgi:hypothetical protein
MDELHQRITMMAAPMGPTRNLLSAAIMEGNALPRAALGMTPRRNTGYALGHRRRISIDVVPGHQRVLSLYSLIHAHMAALCN